MKYGFIGLGNLGRNLAGSLVREAFDVTLTDINPAAAQSLIQAGAHWAQDAQAVAEQVDAVITCLPSPSVSMKVLAGPRGILSAGSDEPNAPRRGECTFGCNKRFRN